MKEKIRTLLHNFLKIMTIKTPLTYSMEYNKILTRNISNTEQFYFINKILNENEILKTTKQEKKGKVNTRKEIMR